MKDILFSYLRHAAVAGVLLLVNRYHLPLGGADELANALVLSASGTLTWGLVKYAPAWAKVFFSQLDKN